MNKNYGVIVAASKMAMVNSCSSYNSYRWVQFGLNPIGDPEMPIYTSSPEEFGNCSVSCDGDNVYVNTGVNECNICMMSNEDDGTTYYEVRNNVQEAIFTNVSSNVSICITKQNFVPKIIDIGYVCIQNEIVTGPQIYEADIIRTGSSVTSTKAMGPVVFDGGNIMLKAKSVIIEPETTINSNTFFIISNQK